MDTHTTARIITAATSEFDKMRAAHAMLESRDAVTIQQNTNFRRVK